MSGLGNQGAYDIRLVRDVLAQKDAEIERLKAEIKDRMALIGENSYQKQLIAELADALQSEIRHPSPSGYRNLLQRAREAVSNE